MGKVWTYVVMSMGMIMLLQFAGIDTGMSSQLFNLTGVNFDGSNLENTTTSASGMFSALFDLAGEVIAGGGILGKLAAGGAVIAIGFFSRGRLENIILLPFITGTLVLFISAMVSITNHAISLGVPWIAAVIAMVFVPFTVGFIVALAEFFRGTD
jgi:hypothetical protein